MRVGSLTGIHMRALNVALRIEPAGAVLAS
jgi:hypothetical protein